MTLPSEKRLRPLVLFVMAHAGFFRHFQNVITVLCAKGIDVHVCCTKGHQTIAVENYDLDIQGPGQLSFEIIENSGQFQRRAELVRLIRDIIHYSRPEYLGAPDLQRRFLNSQKFGRKKYRAYVRVTLALLRRFFRFMPRTVGQWVDQKLLHPIDQKIEPNPVAKELISRVLPDLVVVTPLVDFGSREVDIVKAAQRQAIPTILAVASWDNLSNKGLIKVNVDGVIVWNETLAREAIELQGIDSSKVAITGASLFDAWFTRVPSCDYETFCEMLNLDQSKALIVYLCSSSSIGGGRREIKTIKKWVRTIRGSSDAAVAESNILIRPYPMVLAEWQEELWSERLETGHLDLATVVWPLNAKHPGSNESAAVFFDTLYHATAVVGLNTSAMIEAAILDKPVLTFLSHDAARSQQGNLHFRHLAESGFLHQAADLEEHVSALSRVLAYPQQSADDCRKFIADFVRPLGRDTKVAPLVAERIIKALKISVARP